MAEAEVHGFLENLGLTEYEAKSLNALFKLREAEAPEISRIAQVPKTRVYDVLERLTKKGLIIEIYGRPKKYRSVEVGRVFDSLISEKKASLKELEEKAKDLRGSFSGEGQKEAIEKVMKVKDKSDFTRILGQEIDSAKESVSGFTHFSKEQHLLKDHIKNAKAKKIEIKLIGKIAGESARLAKDFSEHGATVKDFDHGMHAYIIDGKKVVMALSDFSKDQPEYHFTIWPDNKAMANALQKHFDDSWKQGKKL
ncbi:MAG: helix-turn-helix domain-containing protein [Candidatus Diapherotrites archaeon]